MSFLFFSYKIKESFKDNFSTNGSSFDVSDALGLDVVVGGVGSGGGGVMGSEGGGVVGCVMSCGLISSSSSPLLTAFLPGVESGSGLLSLALFVLVFELLLALCF